MTAKLDLDDIETYSFEDWMYIQSEIGRRNVCRILQKEYILPDELIEGLPRGQQIRLLQDLCSLQNSQP